MIQTSLINAVEELKCPYYCNKCKRIHRTNTKIWDEHMGYIEKVEDVISPDAKERIAVIKKSLDEKYRKSQELYTKQRQKEMIGGYNKFIPKLKNGRYFYFEIVPHYGFRASGRLAGYDTLEELYNDHRKFGIRDAEKGEAIAIIMKAVPHKIIKKF